MLCCYTPNVLVQCSKYRINVPLSSTLLITEQIGYPSNSTQKNIPVIIAIKISRCPDLFSTSNTNPFISYALVRSIADNSISITIQAFIHNYSLSNIMRFYWNHACSCWWQRVNPQYKIEKIFPVSKFLTKLQAVRIYSMCLGEIL